MKPIVKIWNDFLAGHKATIVLFKRVLWLDITCLEQRTNLIYNIFLQVQINYVTELCPLVCIIHWLFYITSTLLASLPQLQ
jgi:hypothetical protein